VRSAGRTIASELFEAGAFRLRFPNVGRACEGVLINTAGGMAGGDAARITADLAAGARVLLTTQSAEKVYRAECEAAQLDVRLQVADGAELTWVPQPTILFDGARVERTLAVEMHAGASLTVLESLVFGRVAKGERLVAGGLRDRWRVTRGGSLIFAEDVRLEGAVSQALERPAIGCGARAVATLLHVGPQAEERLGPVRSALVGGASECGVSAWDGMLLARFAGQDAAAVRADVARVVAGLCRLPRVWTC
jgi:urease accessory protein